MVDSVTADGESRQGFMPSLLGLLGAGSFDDSLDARWLTHLVSADSRLGREFREAWDVMRHEVGEQQPGSVLSVPAAMAGQRRHRIQAALTRARERHAYQELDVAIRALPLGDRRRLAWLNVNRYSAAW
eukprot:6157655-Karenia_brevis.AAC.1